MLSDLSPARANSPVRTLSGGERNRVLLARLFALPANVLVLDEPTNDLDIDTLELLEELLQNYAGTVFLVSHDRRFLDNVVTSLIAYEGEIAPGLWREYEGGIEDWRTQRARSLAAAAPKVLLKAVAASAVVAAPVTAAKPRAKLSFKEKRELDELPARIAALEAEQRALQERLASPELYTVGATPGATRSATAGATGDATKVAALQSRHAQIDDELLASLERWELLGSR